MPSDGEDRLHVYIPAELKESMRQLDGSYKAITVEALMNHIGVDLSSEAAIENRLGDLAQEEESLVQTIQEKAENLHNVRKQRRDLHERLENIRAQKESYQERLDAILDALVQTQQGTIYNAQVAGRDTLRQLAIDEHGGTASSDVQAVIVDLKDRRTERELAIPDHRFTEHGQPQGAVADGEGPPRFKTTAQTEGDD